MASPKSSRGSEEIRSKCTQFDRTAAASSGSPHGLLKLLTWQLADYERRTPLDDKLRFATFCKEIGVPTPPLLGIARDGVLTLEPDAAPRLDQDLFIKPVKSKARAASRSSAASAPAATWTRRAGARPRHADGPRRRTLEGDALMVQQRLINHPGLADLADQSLMAARIITCLERDAAGARRAPSSPMPSSGSSPGSSRTGR